MGTLGCFAWCVPSEVHSVMVRWPNFTDPNAATYENLSFAIPGVEAKNLRKRTPSLKP